MRGRFFYGWLIVGICLVSLVITAGVGFYSIGVFFNPLMEEFGWNRTQIAAIVTVYFGISGLASPLVGRFLDIQGASRIMFFGLMGPYSEQDRAIIARERERAVIGTPDTVKHRLLEILDAFQADELMLITITGDYGSRLRSYELVAEAFDRQSLPA